MKYVSVHWNSMVGQVGLSAAHKGHSGQDFFVQMELLSNGSTL